jgi:hypothetical protein
MSIIARSSPPEAPTRRARRDHYLPTPQVLQLGTVHVLVGLFSTPPPFILHHTSTRRTPQEPQTGMLLLRSGPRAPSPRRILISIPSDADYYYYYYYSCPILPVPKLGYVQRRGCASAACR